MSFAEIKKILSDKAKYYLDFESKTFDRSLFTFPSSDRHIKIFRNSNRNSKVVSNLKKLYAHGRLQNTGYLSILPVDQGVEHSAGASFAKNPIYFDPENIASLAVEGGCNALVSSLGVLGLICKKYQKKIPLILKLNHNELLSYPNKETQRMYASVKQAVEMGAVGVGATIYFGSPDCHREIEEVRTAFEFAHELGLFTVLWCYVRNSNFKIKGVNYETSADLTGQANHLGVTLGADIIKQKLPTSNRGYLALNKGKSDYGKVDVKIYKELTSDHPIDLTRYQLANCYLGKIPMISSGGASGKNDFQEAVISAVVNKRSGGSGLIMGRKAFQRSFKEGVKILNLVQDVYACEEISIA